jgi:hypothetical protein
MSFLATKPFAFIRIAYKFHTVYDFKAVSWLRQLVYGFSPRRPGFDRGSVHVGFVVDKVAPRQVFPRVLRFSPVKFIPPVLH